MQAMVKRFDFGQLQDFAAPPPAIEIVTDNTLPEAEEIAPPPPPSFSEEELNAAKAAAWEEGRIAGVEEEKQRQETEAKARARSIEQACQTLAREALSIAQRQQQFFVIQTQELSELAMLLAQKVAGDALAQLPEGSAKLLVQQCLPVLQQQPRVVLMVHSTIAEQMDAAMRELIDAHHFETHITVKGSDQFQPGEARLEWQDGLAERRMDTIWNQIKSIIEQIDFTQLAQAQPTMAEAVQASPPSSDAVNREVPAMSASSDSAAPVQAPTETHNALNDDSNNQGEKA